MRLLHVRILLLSWTGLGDEARYACAFSTCLSLPRGRGALQSKKALARRYAALPVPSSVSNPQAAS